MVGAIRKRDVVVHPVVTIRCFGWPVFLKTVIAGRRQTFLTLLAEANAFGPPTVEVPSLLENCVFLELQAKLIYEALAERFSDRAPVREFFETLAQQEQDHADLLELCGEIAGQEGWQEEHFGPWRDAIPVLEQQMDTVEASLGDLDSVTDALRLVIQVESSEINRVFESVVTATDSGFVRHLEPFHAAGVEHISYISDRIPKLESSLAKECEALSVE
jgi:ferritin